MTTAHDFSLMSIDGAKVPLKSFEGKVLLVVNVASECGYTPQYKGLEALYEERRASGLEVLGVPCNQFGGQEPGSDDEIKAFCESRYHVSFPMFSKVDVNGVARHPLYAWMCGLDAKPHGAGDVKWNFGKFVIDRAGNVVARFGHRVEPNAPEVVDALGRAGL